MGKEEQVGYKCSIQWACIYVHVLRKMAQSVGKVGGEAKGRDGESKMDQLDVQDAKLSLKMV